MGGNVCPDGGRCEVEGTLINTARQRVSLDPGALGSLQMREKASRVFGDKEREALCFLAWCVGSLPVQLGGFCCGRSFHSGRQTEMLSFCESILPDPPQPRDLTSLSCLNPHCLSIFMASP